MGSRIGRILVFIIVGCGFISNCAQAQATAIAFSNLSATNLQVSPASGAVVFTDTFTAEAFAQGQNSLGELVNQFDTGPLARADAGVTWANGYGSADGPGLRENGSTTVNLPGSGNTAASSTGQGTLSNTFMITGGSGLVLVGFAMDLSGLLGVTTDPLGQLAQTEINFNLQVDGNPLLFEHRQLSGGPNSSLGQTVAETVTGSSLLQFNTPYFLLLQVDSESNAINVVPEPATGILLFIGVVALFFCREELVRR